VFAGVGATVPRPAPNGGRLSCSPFTAQTGTTFTAPDRRHLRLVLGRVWLPKSTTILPWPSQPNLSSGDRFLKQGVIVTAGSPVTLTVPVAARRIYALAYGNPSSAIAGSRPSVRIAPCPRSAATATAWPGGYLAVQRACVALIVTAGGRSTRVSLSLGISCSA
jgi:hypothetical protein